MEAGRAATRPANTLTIPGIVVCPATGAWGPSGRGK